jgi:hypothetical protein
MVFIFRPIALTTAGIRMFPADGENARAHYVRQSKGAVIAQGLDVVSNGPVSVIAEG